MITANPFLSVTVGLFGSILLLATITSAALGAQNISIIRDRLANSVLPNQPADIKKLDEQANKYAASLLPNGSWKDVNYRSNGRSVWVAIHHLDRTLVMAKSARLHRNAGRADAALEAKVVLALKYWTDHDFQNPNWWWNQIGVPQLTGEISSLMWPDLPTDEVAKVIQIMSRGKWERWTGANLVWGVTNQIVRGCLAETPAVVDQAYRRMYQEIKIVPPGQEGIQQDFSFHQHGDQLYNGGYGRAFGNDIGRFASFAEGTKFQMPPKNRAIFDHYLHDGQQWMIWKNTFDYSACGREITRKGLVARSHDWTRGPISPVGAAYALPATDRPVGPLGNKQFWCSDYMVQRSPNFFSSVKMLSNRMLNGEIINREGRKSQHLSDGANFLYLTGDEYKDIFPVWDWTKIPGTTAIQGTLDIGGKHPVSQRGRSPFAGGVSDGTDGACAMDLLRGHLSAHKAWFFFGDAYVCLGSGINLVQDNDHSVATDVNQLRVAGKVLTNQSPQPLATGRYTDPLPIRWVYHDHVGYIFKPGQRVCMSLQNQTGRWSDIGAGSNESVTMPVFNLWLDHGKSCKDATYQYTVIPGITVTQLKQRAAAPKFTVLANEAIQAVYSPQLHLVEAVFRQPGTLQTPLGQLTVNHECILMLRKMNSACQVTAANPENQPLQLKVDLAGRSVAINLPSGNFAGSSVSTNITAK